MKKPELITCNNFHKQSRKGKCNGKYCDSCLQRHYGTSVEQLRGEKEWTCFECLKTCACAGCRRDRGEDIPVKKRKKRSSVVSEMLHQKNTPARLKTQEGLEQKERCSSPEPSLDLSILAIQALSEQWPPKLSEESPKRKRAKRKEGAPSPLSASKVSLESDMPRELELVEDAAFILSSHSRPSSPEILQAQVNPPMERIPQMHPPVAAVVQGLPRCDEISLLLSKMRAQVEEVLQVVLTLKKEVAEKNASHKLKHSEHLPPCQLLFSFPNQLASRKIEDK